MSDLAEMFNRNAAYVAPGEHQYDTQLPLLDELLFRNWVQQNNVPFSPDAVGPQDYDMRGFYRGLQQGNPRARQGVNPNDNAMHYSDYWKTPYHATFSNESQWAGPMAPRWNDQDQLVAPSARILADERRPAPSGLASLFAGAR